MKSLVRKMWVLPLFGLIFFWGVSMINMPSKASLSGNSLIAAARLSPIKDLKNERDEAIVTIRGRVAKFKEHEQLVIDDGTEQINIEYQNKYKPLRLQVGDLITVKGELDVDRNDYREIIASEIWNQSRQVYPQRKEGTYLLSEYSQTRYADEDQTNGNALLISEIVKNGRTGQFVTLEGTVVDLPDEELIILRDSSGDILVDIDDAQKTLQLKKGDKISVQGNITNGFNGKKELEATRIEKQTSR